MGALSYAEVFNAVRAEMPDADWTDVTVEAQRRFHGDVVMALIRDAATAQEMFGDDELERFASEYKRAQLEKTAVLPPADDL
jgi:hypothetical protein